MAASGREPPFSPKQSHPAIMSAMALKADLQLLLIFISANGSSRPKPDGWDIPENLQFHSKNGDL